MSAKIKNIIIANDAEAFESIINTISDGEQRLTKIHKEHFLSNRFLFWEGDNKTVITPFPLDKALILQAQSLGYKHIENWHPATIDISLSRAIVEDKILLENLKKLIAKNPGITLSPYSFTKDFSDLVNTLRKNRLIFAVDQEPIENVDWLVGYLGSKMGFRIELQKLQKNIPLLEFFICKSREEILQIAAWFYKRKKSSVIKAFSGEGGWGVCLVQKENYDSESALRLNLQSIIEKDTIWNSGPYVVEELISSPKNNQNSPSLEVFIDKKEARITYLCNQLLDPSGSFLGILMGKGSLQNTTALKIKRIGKIIAHRYRDLGYRGFFDIDFIMSTDGIPYPIETNVRRTGGTHVFDLTRYLFGKNWARRTVVISVDSFEYEYPILSAKNILERMSEITFPMNGQPKGLVLVATDTFKPVFSFVIFAPHKAEALAMYKKLTDIWKRNTLNIQ